MRNISDLKIRLNQVMSNGYGLDEQLTLLYMWVKQKTINRKEFADLVKHIIALEINLVN